MSKSYEELMGALGRNIYFRPERRRVRDLLSRDANPCLEIGDREFRLFDISMNGVSFLADAHPEEWPVGEEVDLRLLLYGEQLFTGRARIARFEPGPRGGGRVGLALRTGFIDLPEVRRQDDEARLERDLIEGPDQWRERVPARFQQEVARAAAFLSFYRQLLDRHEARYRASGVNGSESVHALAERALTRLREPWEQIQRSASRAAVECLGDPEVLLLSKTLTETVITPIMMEVPLVQRAYTKPLGYAGDYQIMLFYYRNALEGDSVYAQVFHKLSMEHPLSAGVRTRKDFIVELMSDEHDRLQARGGGSAEFRVTSVACGPGREVADYIARRRGWAGTAVWTLIDQEEQALSIAYHDGHRELARHASTGELHCLHLSFMQMLRDPAIVATLEPQHLIFSTGFFDYLRENQAQILLRVLYEQLLPGGLLVIGNALGPNDHFWSPEFIVDWTLLYRTRDEMRRLATRLPETAEVDVVAEPGNAYYFLLVRRH
jgi:SAM-dependent methyltransferase